MQDVGKPGLCQFAVLKRCCVCKVRVYPSLSNCVVDCLNTNYLKIKTHKDYNFTVPKWEADRLAPDVLTANVRWIGALVCSNRKAQSRGTGKTEPA